VPLGQESSGQSQWSEYVSVSWIEKEVGDNVAHRTEEGRRLLFACMLLWGRVAERLCRSDFECNLGAVLLVFWKHARG
jgi:hypothetical protein